MSSDDQSITERLVDAAKMGQEPKDRLWAAISVLVVIVLLVGAVTIYYAAETVSATDRNYEFLRDSRELGYERGTVDCLIAIAVDVRTFERSSYCAKPEVILYYPPEVCAEYFMHDATCGDEWVV